MAKSGRTSRHCAPGTGPGEYVVYAGFGEPAGLLNYGGRHYYSDGPPWMTAYDLVADVFRKKSPKAQYRLVDSRCVSEETWEKARANSLEKKYRR